jgi:TRAP-type uncharacterized transport system fused permease subunit
VAFVIPVVFISRPEMLLIGEPLVVITTIAFITLGCLAMTMTSEAWFKGAIKPMERIGLAAMSLALFADRFDLNLAAAIAFGLWLFWRSRRNARSEASAG